MVTSSSRSTGLNRWFQAAIVLILMCSAALGANALAGFWSGYQKSREGLASLLSFSAVLAIASDVAAERGPANIAMGRAATGAAARAGRLDEIRRRIDAGLAALPASAARTALEETLARSRLAVDAVLDLPRAERDPAAVQRAIETMFAAADLTGPLIDSAMGRTIVPGSNLMGRAITARMLAQLRDQAGRIGSHVVIAVSQSRPLDAAQSVAFGEARGRVVQLWQLLQLQLVASETPALMEARRAVEAEFFGYGLQLIDDARARLREGDPTLSAASFTRAIVPSFRPIETLRDTYLSQIIRQLKTERDTARQAFLLACLAILLTLGAELLLLVCAQRLLFAPLLAARDEVMRLADGHLAPGVPQPSVRGEMRALFEALGRLRDRLLERDRLDLERTRLEDKLRVQAETDGLTGVLNRGALERAAAELSRSSVRVGLILLDLDYFKSVNDRFGHAAGDAVLRATAQRLAAVLAEEDLVARFGGEEFAVLLTGARAEALAAIALQLRQMIEQEPFMLPDHRLVAVTASFGTAVTTARPGMWQGLLEAADAALYQAKTGGRNLVVASG